MTALLAINNPSYTILNFYLHQIKFYERIPAPFNEVDAQIFQIIDTVQHGIMPFSPRAWYVSHSIPKTNMKKTRVFINPGR